MPRDMVKRRAYHARYMREWYAKNPAAKKAQRQLVKARKPFVRAEVEAVVLAFKANGCARCPEKEPYCLDAHHIDPEQKDFEISQARRHGYSAARVAEELTKCLCLCKNCHAKEHVRLRAGGAPWHPNRIRQPSPQLSMLEGLNLGSSAPREGQEG